LLTGLNKGCSNNRYISTHHTSLQPYDKLIQFIQDFRKFAISLLLAVIITTLCFYFNSQYLFEILQTTLDQDLVFLTLAGPFIAHIKLSLGLALFVLIPGFSLCLWKGLSRPFSLSGKAVCWFVIFSCLLFYAGTLFCYGITLPYGIKFLLSFSSEQLQPVISINKFVTFVTVFVLAFGVIFELPIFMVFAVKTGLVSRQAFIKNRRYALLAISIVAALLTPTPDVVNMLLMGVPLYGLYEIGIVILVMLKIR
jgi:sec-independent protein translocase protein TatC